MVMDLPRDWRFPLQQGADITILPLSKAAIHQLPSAVPRMRGSEDQVIWQLPFMIFDRDIPLYRDTLRQLHGAGFRRFEAANLSHFALLRGLDGLHISAWHRCFSLNSQALAAWRELGAETATLYIEDDAVNLAALLAADIAIERRVIVYAPLPVMTTKIRIKDVHSNIPLHSDRGEAYTVTTRDGLQTITAATPFSLTARHNELRSKGCGSFLIDLRQAPRESWNDIIGAFKTGRGDSRHNGIQLRCGAGLMRLLLAICTLLLLAAADSHAARTIEGVVRAVYDGDTILLVTREASRLKVRLYGIDAPETAKPDKPGQPFGEAAKTDAAVQDHGETGLGRDRRYRPVPAGGGGHPLRRTGHQPRDGGRRHGLGLPPVPAGALRLGIPGCREPCPLPARRAVARCQSPAALGIPPGAQRRQAATAGNCPGALHRIANRRRPGYIRFIRFSTEWEHSILIISTQYARSHDTLRYHHKHPPGDCLVALLAAIVANGLSRSLDVPLLPKSGKSCCSPGPERRENGGSGLLFPDSDQRPVRQGHPGTTLAHREYPGSGIRPLRPRHRPNCCCWERPSDRSAKHLPWCAIRQNRRSGSSAWAIWSLMPADWSR